MFNSKLLVYQRVILLDLGILNVDILGAIAISGYFTSPCEGKRS